MRDITLCHPRLQKLIAQLTSECANAGLPIKIGESFRSVTEQDALYAQGRTQPGSIVTNARGSSYSSQPIMNQEIILRKSESLPKSWGLDGVAIGKAS